MFTGFDAFGRVGEEWAKTPVSNYKTVALTGLGLGHFGRREQTKLLLWDMGQESGALRVTRRATWLLRLLQTCKGPGHTRHFPGAVPYTGCWCDFHYRLLSFIHPLGFPGTLLYFGVGVIGVVLWIVLRR